MKKLNYFEILSEKPNESELLEFKRHPIKVLLLNIRSLHNVGSLFRTADSALLEELICVGFTPHPPREEISKTALGADKTVPWRYFEKADDAISQIRNEGYKIIALELTDQKKLYTDLRKEDFPMCLILGNELSGIDDYVIDMCDSSIEIPMYGIKHSLNVSVAAGIAIYEAVRIYRSFE